MSKWVKHNHSILRPHSSFCPAISTNANLLHILTGCLCFPIKQPVSPQQSHMDDNCADRFQEAMDKLWFHQNILLFEPDKLILQASSCTTSTLTEKRSPSKSNPKNKSRKPITKQKSTSLDFVIRQPLFELQPPPRSSINSHPSMFSITSGPQPKSRRRTRVRIRSCKSLSELESYELKGCMDLGFVFQREELNPHIVRMLPGLQRLGEQGEGSEENREEDGEKVRRPYLSEAWLINRSSFPLLNVSMLPKTPEGDEMKRSLRFWARKVASLVLKGP